MSRPRRVEPCHHVWAYYDRKVRERRGKRLKCNQLENLMWDYSMHAAFPFGVVQGANASPTAQASTPIIKAPSRARRTAVLDQPDDPNLCVDPRVW